MLAAVPAFGEPPLWTVKSQNATVFLFGQMGVKANTQWQSANVMMPRRKDFIHTGVCRSDTP